MIANRFDFAENINYFGDFGNYPCEVSKVAALRDKRWACVDRDQVAPGCAVAADGLSMSCTQCQLRGGSEVVYDLVPAPDYEFPFRMGCRRKGLVCDREKGLYYLNDGCYSCREFQNCAECFDDFRGCKVCKPGSVILGESNTCLDCTRASINCLKCHESWFPKLGQILCLECQEGFFLNPVGQCQACSTPNCAKCSSTTCQECKKGYFEENGKCIENCQAGHFWDNGACRECPERDCLVCSKTEGCQECKGGFRLEETTKTCKKGCRDNQFQDLSAEGSPCRDCNQVEGNGGCLKCRQGSGECLECLEGYSFMDGSRYCKRKCRRGQFWTGKDAGNSCAACDSDGRDHCLECEESTGACTKCDQGTYLLDRSFKCVEKCGKKAQYPKLVNNAENGISALFECVDCLNQDSNPKCTSCDMRTGICERCISGYTPATEKHDFRCRRVCNAFEHWSGPEKDECRHCRDSLKYCSRCSDVSGDCEVCEQNYNLKTTKTTKKLKNGRIEASTALKCVLRCSENEWVFENDLTKEQSCRLCLEVKESGVACETCLDYSGTCSSCKDGFVLNKDNFCQRECEEGFYWSGVKLNQCLECNKTSPGCKSCLNDSETCLECFGGYWLNDGFCQKQCPQERTYWRKEENSCFNCPKNCLKCANSTAQCAECDFGFELDSEWNTCREGLGELAEASEELFYDRNGKEPQIVGRFFDKVTGSARLVYDMEIGIEEVRRVMESLEVSLLYEDGKYEVFVSDGKPQNGRIFEVVFLLQIPLFEVNNGRLILRFNSGDDKGAAGDASESKNGKKLRVLAGDENGENDQKSNKNDEKRMISLSRVSYYKTSNLEFFKNAGKWSFWALFVSSCFFLVFLPQAFSNLTTLIQYAQLITLLSVGLPASAQTFLNEFKFDFFTIW